MVSPDDKGVQEPDSASTQRLTGGQSYLKHPLPIRGECSEELGGRCRRLQECKEPSHEVTVLRKVQLPGWARTLAMILRSQALGLGTEATDWPPPVLG